MGSKLVYNLHTAYKIILIAFIFRIMEWTDKHDIQLAREVLVSEPYHFRPRTVERGNIWQEIANRLNESTLLRFKVTKRSTREHFTLLLEKYKLKRKNEAKLSGVDVQDSELDIAMEEIWEKWQEAESQDAACNVTNKKKMEADRASAEEVRKKACEKLGESTKRKKLDEEGTEIIPKKSRRYGSDTIEFLREKAKQDRAARQEELKCKEKEQERQTQLQEQVAQSQQQQQQQQMLMINMMQQQNKAVLELMAKLSQPK